MMIASPYDPESRDSDKRGRHWRGYKVHLTATCDDAMPSLITHVATTAATEQDVTAVDAIYQALAAHALLPAVHLVDGAYVSSDALVASHQDYQVTRTGPMRQDQSWQAHDDDALDTSRFVIDGDQEVVTCPTGTQSRYGQPATGPRGQPTMQVLFPKKACAGCAVRSRCTRSITGPRELTLHPKA
jgi:transposase